MANVFLSYQEKHQKNALKLRDALKSRGYATLFDGDERKAVENAAVVIMCMSAAYKANADCEKEIDEAKKLNKPIIPINVEAGFEPSEWLVSASGSDVVVIDFSDPQKFKEKLKELLKELTAMEIKPDAAAGKKRKKKKEKDDGEDDDDNEDGGDGDGGDDGKGGEDKGGDDDGADGDDEGGCCGGGEDGEGDDAGGCSMRCVCARICCIYRYLERHSDWYDGRQNYQ